MIIFAAWMYLELIYAIGIGAAIFFGLKAIAISKQASISKQVGKGLCMECGEKIIDNKCPNCDLEKTD